MAGGSDHNIDPLAYCVAGTSGEGVTVTLPLPLSEFKSTRIGFVHPVAPSPSPNTTEMRNAICFISFSLTQNTGGQWGRSLRQTLETTEALNTG